MREPSDINLVFFLISPEAKQIAFKYLISPKNDSTIFYVPALVQIAKDAKSYPKRDAMHLPTDIKFRETRTREKIL